MARTIKTDSAQTQVYILQNAHEHVHIDALENGTVYVQILPDAQVAHVELSIESQPHIVATVIMLCAQSVPVRIVQTAAIAAHSHVDLHVYTVALGSVDHTITHTVQEDACSNVTYVAYASLQDTLQCNIENIFAGVSGRGLITMQTIAEHSAHVTCNGKITIAEVANQTDAYLTEHILMLDRTAKVHAIPSLEIKTNDVKASHSATIVHITPTDLFYFSARGIAEHIARRMYIESFFSVHIDVLPESVQSDVLQALQRKLPLLHSIDVAVD